MLAGSSPYLMPRSTDIINILARLIEKRAYRPYVLALTILWMSCTSSFIFDWLRAHDAFIVHNGSPTSVLEGFDAFSNTSPFISVIISNVVSDGILVIVPRINFPYSALYLISFPQIWRCHILWKRKSILAILIAVLVSSSGR